MKHPRWVVGVAAALVVAVGSGVAVGEGSTPTRSEAQTAVDTLQRLVDGAYSTPTATPSSSPTVTPSVTPTPSPTPSPSGSNDNPLGSIGARSGLWWNSGIWPLARQAGDASYTANLKYAEQRRGKPSDINMAAQYYGSWNDLTGLQVLTWLNAYGGTPVLMLPPFPQGGSWGQAAAGAYDAYYRQIGARIVQIRPDGKTVLRFAWEANGNWYPWSIVSSGGAGAFKAGWAKAATAMRAGAAAKAGNIVFNYSTSNLDDKGQGDPLTATYPGDAYVDILGQDSYDHWQVTTSATTPAKVDSLNRMYSFAQTHGKWMALDEWGLHNTGTKDPEGKDNPKYISAMFGWIKTHPLAYEQYFQDDAQNNVNSSLFSSARDSNPQSRAVYLQEMR